MHVDRSSVLGWLAAHDQLDVVPLVDPIVEALGHDPRSPYAETYWLPVLGPSSVMLLRRIADWLDASPDGFPLPMQPAAASLGLAHHGGSNSSIVRTLGRLVFFEMAAIQGQRLAVRRMLPPLARRHVSRLPGHLAEQHRAAYEASPKDVSVIQ